jgi:hypothetical protein
MRAPTQWSDSNICIPIWPALVQMLESKDHQQIEVFSGVSDLTFALRTPGYRAANVKSTSAQFDAFTSGHSLSDKGMKASSGGT